MAFYTRRFHGLAGEVAILEQRAASGSANPQELRQAIEHLRTSVETAQAVGDLAELAERLDALGPVLELQRRARRVERERRTAEVTAAKERLVAEAEQVAHSSDWRGGGDRLVVLLSQWKDMPRLDRRTDDTLWRRYSAARSTFGKRRKQHYAAQDEQRAHARSVKERLAAEAEALAASTDWGPTGRRYRDLMQQWKAAGPAPRAIDDALWRRFRAAQDTFFAARDGANALVDAEQSANADFKREIVARAEALLPASDPAAARAALRPLLERWESAGRVPKDQVRQLERRMRAVEEAVGRAEAERWRRSDPEAQARAADMVAQLEAGLTRLTEQREAAQARADDAAAAALTEQIETREAWLEQARRGLVEFGG